MTPKVIEGDILVQKVEAIVNTWNRNIIPWWLLLPQGVSGAIKRHAGLEPFRELAKIGPIPLGDAVLTCAGKLPYKGIIHVAGINIFWFATEESIRKSVASAMKIVNDNKFGSVVFPIIGAGSGSYSKNKSLNIMLNGFESIETDADVYIIKYKK